MRLLELHLEVSDLKRSLALYSRLIPHTKVVHWEDGSAAALVLDDGSAFGLWKKGKLGILQGRGGEHVHFAFKIEGTEYDRYKTLIEECGLKVLEHDWGTGHRSLYFFDYDSHQGEFMTVDWLGRGNNKSG